MNNFTHCHLHNEFSYLDGFGSAKNYIEKIKFLGQDFACLTNHGNLDGLIEWQQECEKQNIKYCLGVEAYIVPDANIKDKNIKNAHIIFLIKDQAGFEILCKMMTKAHLNGFYRKPRISFSDLLYNDLSGLIITTACLNSWINFDQGEDVLKELYNKYPDNIYLEIMPHDLKEQYIHNEKILKLHDKYDIPLVASNDCHYVNKDDWESQEMLLAIQSKSKWSDSKRFKFSIQGLHLATRREMLFNFRKHKHIFTKDQIEDALNNTVKIAKTCCNFKIQKKSISLPMPFIKGDDNKILQNKCSDWLMENKINNFLKAHDHDIYLQRLVKEFNLIKKKNFSRYFLIVEDVVKWAQKENIAVGPGRGSAGGSLICFILGITGIDPIKYGLSFSRFISEDRIDFPDIDIDFEKRYKSKVYDYLRDKYGENNICGISTTMRMKSNAAFRDVCRVFDIPLDEVSKFAKLIKQGDDNGIQKAIDENKECKRFEKEYPRVIHFAKKMEGVVKNVGRHAAAVVISDEDLTQGTKCVLVKRKDDIVCNWDMDNSEYSGLMKLDVLGLSTLTVLSECKKLINELHDPDFDFDKIPFDDPKVFKLLNTKKTAGIFQMSTSALAKLCKKIQIENLNDIVAAIALVRPGPWSSGMTENYIERKHGKKWKKLHPIYEEITKDTYGIIVYQEQISKIIYKIAGLSKVIADKIRKIIAKKRDAKLLEEYHNMFIEGCIKQKTLSKSEAVDFWDAIVENASYLFNLAHSTAYAIIGYWTGFCKANYPVEFICSSLSFAEWDEKSTDKYKRKSTLFNELVDLGIEVYPPKIGYSDAIKWVVKDNILYIPFIEISGIGEKQAEKCCNLKKKSKNRLKGFFGKEFEPVQKGKTKVDIILDELKCHNHNSFPKVDIIKKYLGFKI